MEDVGTGPDALPDVVAAGAMEADADVVVARGAGAFLEANAGGTCVEEGVAALVEVDTGAAREGEADCAGRREVEASAGPGRDVVASGRRFVFFIGW